MFDTVIQILHGFELDRKCKLSFKHFGYIEKRPCFKEINFKSREGRLEGIFSSSISEQKLQSIIQEFDNKQIETKLSKALKTGGQFKEYGQIDNVFDQEKTKLAHKNNQVLLVNVWATWSHPSQKGIRFNQHLLQKNQEKWKQKVRIVGLSLDQTKDTIKKRVIDKKWQKLSHLTLLGFKEDHPFIVDYKIQGIPFLCLVNKWGKVDFVGNPADIDIQKRINQLLAEQNDSSITQNPYIHPQDTKTKLEYKNSTYNTIFHLSQQQVQKYFHDTDFIVLRYQFENTLNNGVFNSSFHVSGYVLDDQGEQKKVAGLFGNPENIQIKLEKFKYLKVPNKQHPDCFLCSQKALNYPYYWLNFEEGEAKFGCRGCVEKKSEVEGHHYFYEKNSIFLNGYWSSVGQKDIGKNIQPTDIVNFKNSQGYKCNNCGGGNQAVGHARYANLGARAEPNFATNGKADLCGECLEKVIKRDVEVCNKLYTQEGIEYNFPYLRILYKVNSYAQY